MPTFSADAIKKLKEELLSINNKYERLFMAFVQRTYKVERAKEYSTHGFPRRLNIMLRCVQNVFTLLPPESDEVPTRETRLDVMLNIQAFMFNVFDALDNLAWVWIHETGLKAEDGKEIPYGWVGLGPKNKFVRQSFSEPFQNYLKALDGWHEFIGNFRHALAHRIPLYIPPYVVLTKNQAAYQELEVKMADAVRRFDFTEHERLSLEQSKLTSFKPWMQHSFGEKSRTVYFHPQMIADFNTVDEVGWQMLDELDRFKSSQPAIPSTV